LCTPDSPVILERMDFPDPVIKIAVEPASKGEMEKMGMALNRLGKEDPSFRYSLDPETGETTIEGMGELHLDIIVDRMKREFKVDCKVGEPQVAYRESITKAYTMDYTHKKQSGGSGQFAKIQVEFSPLTEEDKEGMEGDKGAFIFAEEIKGGAVPKEYIPGVEKGIKSILGNGVKAGFPMVGLKAKLIDGSYHDVDSSVMAFEIAGRQAAREGLQKCGPRLMEPIMKVEVVVPEENMASVVGDVNSRRGMIVELGARGNMKTVEAKVPLANMFQYVSDLRSMTKGRAQYTMVFSEYELVPPNVEQELVKQYGQGAAVGLAAHDPEGDIVSTSAATLLFGCAAGFAVILSALKSSSLLQGSKQNSVSGERLLA